MAMDHKIYFPTAADYGVYGTRRYPKGSSPAIAAQTPGIPTDPHDPNSNPVVVQLHYGASQIAPHALTERWTYTCPPKRRGRIETAFTLVQRETVATVALGYFSRILLTRAQHVAIKVSTTLVQSGHQGNLSGDNNYMVNPGPIELFEGDVLNAETGDNSTAGLILYKLSATLIEYDSLHPVIGSEARFTEGFAGPRTSDAGLRGSGGIGSGGVIIRSESPRDPVNWISLGNSYYQRRI